MFPSSYASNDDYVLLKKDLTDAFICPVLLHDTKRHNSSSHNILARTVENIIEANTSGEELNEGRKSRSVRVRSCGLVGDTRKRDVT